MGNIFISVRKTDIFIIIQHYGRKGKNSAPKKMKRETQKSLETDKVALKKMFFLQNPRIKLKQT